MPAPAVGTPVRVLWSGLGYTVTAPGQILATQDSWTEDAAGDMPPVASPDLAHIAVFAASSGGLSAYLMYNTPQGDGLDQFQTV